MASLALDQYYNPKDQLLHLTFSALKEFGNCTTDLILLALKPLLLHWRWHAIWSHFRKHLGQDLLQAGDLGGWPLWPLFPQPHLPGRRQQRHPQQPVQEDKILCMCIL